MFSAAFNDRPPFLGLDDRKRRSAARAILEHARAGGDGPFVEQASFVATADPRDGAAGGILVTLLPAADLSDWRSFAWPEPPPADAVGAGSVGPTSPGCSCIPLAAGQGVGTVLLHAATRGLLGLGYTELASTFLLGNDSSTLWHWRNGFQLIGSPWSLRR